MYFAPSQIKQLGLCADDYVSIAHNLGKVVEMSENQRQDIFDRANSDLSKEVIKIVMELPLEMMNNRDFCREAGLDYAKGIPVQGCFTAAVADYILRNQEKVGIREFYA